MDRNPPHQTAPYSRLILVTCPNCASHKAVVAATHYGKHLCFCPACEQVWDCDAALIGTPPKSEAPGDD